MRKIFYLLLFFVTVAFCACVRNNPNTQFVQCDAVGDTVYVTEYCRIYVVEIDSCEYLMGSTYGSHTSAGFMAHKGNCKYCEERRKQEQRNRR